jgi:hypothetical protein
MELYEVATNVPNSAHHNVPLSIACVVKPTTDTADQLTPSYDIAKWFDAVLEAEVAIKIPRSELHTTSASPFVSMDVLVAQDVPLVDVIITEVNPVVVDTAQN